MCDNFYAICDIIMVFIEGMGIRGKAPFFAFCVCKMRKKKLALIRINRHSMRRIIFSSSFL